MFDWLFGSGRQVDPEYLRNTSRELGRYNADLAGYYADNIAGDKFGSLDRAKQAEVASIYNQMVNNSKMASEQYGGLYDVYNQEEEANKYNYFGNGLLGVLLNPIGQTVTAGVDLATGNYEGRDAMSDLGALGETALTFLPGIGLAGKGAKAFGSVKGMAGLGAGFGAANALKEGGSDTNFGDVLSQAGTGALFGGGIGFAGNKLGGMMRNRGANNIVGKYMADNPTGAKAFLENNMTGQLRNQVAKQPNFLGNYGGLYGNALQSIVPKSRFGKLTLVVLVYFACVKE